MTHIPKYSEFSNDGMFLSGDMSVYTDIPIIKDYFIQSFSKIYPNDVSFRTLFFTEGVPNHVKKKVYDTFSVEYSHIPDAYVIIADNDVKVYSESKRGLIYGAFTLAELARGQFIKKGVVYEAPVCEVRGAKVYLPGKDGIAFFKQYIDLLCAFRMNTIMIEIGGAMEYKRHPEINAGWVEYCSQMSEYSGKTMHIQEEVYGFLKNSIHVENGEGGYLSQDEVRELVAYCRRYHMEIIPEVPSLSHSDYLLIRHPELRERHNDDYADTYCPSDERTYELLFDILDEVIEVFNPSVINIGHDEYYSIGICERCKSRDPVDIYASDIITIYNYLKERSIKTIIWSDKCLNVTRDNGNPDAGAAKARRGYSDMPMEPIPATYPAIDKLPKDIGMLHWFWRIGNGYDEDHHIKGFELTYGNFKPERFANWRKRMERGIRGAIISNWSALKEINVQRNGMLYDIAYSNLLFWEDDYSEDLFPQLRQQAFLALYEYRLGKIKNGIKITHTTTCHMDYVIFHDGVFIEPDKYDLGYYRLSYADGKTARLPVLYGENISCMDMEWGKDERRLAEIAFTTIPRRIKKKNDEGFITVYETVYENPYPDSEICAIEFVSNPKKETEVYMRSWEVLD